MWPNRSRTDSNRNSSKQPEKQLKSQSETEKTLPRNQKVWWRLSSSCSSLRRSSQGGEPGWSGSAVSRTRGDLRKLVSLLFREEDDLWPSPMERPRISSSGRNVSLASGACLRFMPLCYRWPSARRQPLAAESQSQVKGQHNGWDRNEAKAIKDASLSEL